MTKRFTINDCRVLSNEQVLKILNQLTEENEQLKTQLQNTSDQRDEFHRGARENANRVGKLEKENEQLRKDVARYRGNFREMEDIKCELAEENKRLKNEIETYKSGNALLKKTLDKEWK